MDCKCVIIKWRIEQGINGQGSPGEISQTMRQPASGSDRSFIIRGNDDENR